MTSSCNVPYHRYLTPGPDRAGEGGRRKRGDFPAGRPLLSVVTVVRDGADFLRTTIESVLAKRTGSLEYIIIDGASTDGTLEQLQEFDRDIDYWVSEPDDGIYDAMNKGVACSSGKYVLFLNARDELVLDLRDIDDLLAKDFVLIYGKANMMEDDRQIVYVKGKKLRHIRKLITGTPLCHQAILYKRDEIGCYDLRYKIIADRVLTYEMIRNYGLDRTFFLDAVVANYFEGGFSRLNYSKWREEELAFLQSVGCHLYAEYRRMGWYWKKFRKVVS